MITNIGKPIKLDWSRVLERCTPHARKNIMNLRSRHEELRRQILDAQTSVPKVDFDYYRHNLSTKEYGSMLADYESKIRSFQPLKIDLSQKLTELEKEKQAKMQEATEFLQKLEAEISKLKDQLEKLKAAKPFDQMTVEDVYQLHPEFKENIYESIKKDNWSTTDEKNELDNHINNNGNDKNSQHSHH